MNIPKYLKIGGKQITVKFVPVGDLGSALARWEPTTYTIKIENNPKWPREKTEEAFLHEIIEAVDSFYELDLPHIKINLLGEVLYQIFKDNQLEL